jgi:hypothetical protein
MVCVYEVWLAVVDSNPSKMYALLGPQARVELELECQDRCGAFSKKSQYLRVAWSIGLHNFMV